MNVSSCSSVLQIPSVQDAFEPGNGNMFIASQDGSERDPAGEWMASGAIFSVNRQFLRNRNATILSLQNRDSLPYHPVRIYVQKQNRKEFFYVLNHPVRGMSVVEIYELRGTKLYFIKRIKDRRLYGSKSIIVYQNGTIFLTGTSADSFSERFFTKAFLARIEESGKISIATLPSDDPVDMAAWDDDHFLIFDRSKKLVYQVQFSDLLAGKNEAIRLVFETKGFPIRAINTIAGSIILEYPEPLSLESGKFDSGPGGREFFVEEIDRQGKLLHRSYLRISDSFRFPGYFKKAGDRTFYGSFSDAGIWECESK